MKRRIIILTFIISASFTFGQNIPKEYWSLLNTADSLFTIKEYKKSAIKYSEAFEVIENKILTGHEYNAACSWALAKVPNSAFFLLFKLSKDVKYKEYEIISKDQNLASLHKDNRWESLLEIIKKNKDSLEINYNKSLIRLLDNIFYEDVQCRGEENDLETKYGWEAVEVVDYKKLTRVIDSLHQMILDSIVNKYGWLGANVVGEIGNKTLFIIIQHSNLFNQEKYLPILRDAVKKGNALGEDLALLEDRVSMGLGRKQIYGSQLKRDLETLTYYVWPIEDPDNVDKRRAEVGLEPMEDYLSIWKMHWDVEQYKIDLPKLEEKMGFKY